MKYTQKGAADQSMGHLLLNMSLSTHTCGHAMYVSRNDIFHSMLLRLLPSPTYTYLGLKIRRGINYAS